MVNLYKANQSVGYNYRPKHSAENTVNDKTDTAYHIYNPDFSYIFQYETQHDKK